MKLYFSNVVSPGSMSSSVNPNPQVTKFNSKSLGVTGMSPTENKMILSRRKMEPEFKTEENGVFGRQTISTTSPILPAITDN